jgi:hypothetical protein
VNLELLLLLARFFLFFLFRGKFRVLGFVEFVSLLRKVDLQLQEEEEEDDDDDVVPAACKVVLLCFVRKISGFPGFCAACFNIEERRLACWKLVLMLLFGSLGE